MKNPQPKIETNISCPVPPLLLRTASARGFIRANTSFRSSVGYGEKELTQEPFLNWINPAHIEAAKATIAGKQASCKVEHRTPNGSFFPLEIRVVEKDGESIILGRGVEDFPLDDAPEDADDVATVSGTLHTIARIVEEQNPGYKCSILLVADGRFVRGAGPSLPEDYNSAIDGFAIGPTVGSCGTAIFWNVPVIVKDIQADPLWVPFAELAKKAGIASCWSHPFESKTGNVLGALALYSPEIKSPTQEQLGRLRAAARLTGLAVERGRAEESLRKNQKRELELEEQLGRAAKMEALGVLAGGIAHDFNNILAAILANAEFGSELLPRDSEVQEMLNDIMVASERAGQICQQMLDYAGKGSLSTTRIEIGALVPELHKLLQAGISQKIAIEYKLHERPIFVEGDENQLIQVFMNLLTNATEAIGDKEGQIKISSVLAHYDGEELKGLDPQTVLTPGEYVRLSVSDNGPGLDSEMVNRIFDPFFSTKVTGRGLGLSAVKGIIHRHGGVIQIQCEQEKGTTFTVILPTVQHTLPKVKDLVHSSSELEKKCVLIADDEADIRSIFSRKLKYSNFDILEAVDGQDAVDIFYKHHQSIDCVLLDFNMPKLNGVEVQQAIHALRDDVPIIMMSGFSEQEVVNRKTDGGLVNYLQKPVPIATLLDSIQKAIGAQS